MKILWVTMESILPANSGGKILVLKRIEQLCKTNDIYLFYPYDNESDLNYVEDIKKYCKEVHYYSRNANKKNAILNLLKYPYTISSRNIKQMQEDIAKCINENDIDVINIDMPHMCVNFMNLNINIPIILNEQNIEYLTYKSISKSQKNILKKIVYKIDSYRLKNFEDKMIKKLNINMITSVSVSDMEFFKKNYKNSVASFELVPIGADLIDISDIKENEDSKNIIFVGKMSYGPNAEAAKWFVHNVFGKVKEKCGNAKFYIVGKDPSEDLIKLSSDDVIVTGSVDSVEKYYDLADLVVIPLLNGGGVKVKLLEAVSHNKKIVSSTKGVEGTLYLDGTTIPVSDNYTEFADLCLRSLNNEEEIIARKNNAYQIFVNNYTWDNIGKKYNEIIKKVVENGKM